MTDYKKLIREVWDLVDDSPDWPRLGTTLDSLEVILNEMLAAIRLTNEVSRGLNVLPPSRPLPQESPMPDGSSERWERVEKALGPRPIIHAGNCGLAPYPTGIDNYGPPLPRSTRGCVCDCEPLAPWRALVSLRTEHDRLKEERDNWREAFQGKQLYPISEMEQKLAHSEVLREDALAEVERLREVLKRFTAWASDDLGTSEELESLFTLARAALEGAECDGTCPSGRYCREHGDLLPKEVGDGGSA